MREIKTVAVCGAGVMGRIEGFSGPPTADDLWLIDRSWDEVPPVIDRVNALVTDRADALLRRVYADAVRPRPAEAIRMPSRR